jgi:hypothetical protein
MNFKKTRILPAIAASRHAAESFGPHGASSLYLRQQV